MRRRAMSLIPAVILSLAMAVPAAATDHTEIVITIDRFGGFSSDGAAIVTGTVLCAPEGSVFADVYVEQKFGGRMIDGWGLTDEMICDGTVHRWVGGALSREVDDQGNWLYKASPAFASVHTHDGTASAQRKLILRPSH